MISKSTDFYTRQDIWGVEKASLWDDILTHWSQLSYTEFIQPLKERTFQGRPMPSRDAKVVKHFWDLFTFAQNSDVRDGFSLSSESNISVVKIAKLLSGSDWYVAPYFRSMSLSLWNGTQIPLSSLKLVAEGKDDVDTTKANEKKGKAEKDALDAYNKVQQEFWTKYQTDTDKLATKYRGSNEGALSGLISDATKVESDNNKKQQDEKSKLATNYITLVSQIKNKPISEKYTQTDKQKELDNALLEYQESIHRISQEYLLSKECGLRSDKVSSKLSAEYALKSELLNAEYYINLHNAGIDYKDALKKIQDDYNSATKEDDSTAFAVAKAKIQEQYDSHFFTVNCYNSMKEQTRIGLVPSGVTSSGTSTNPPFKCNQVCVREMMAAFADLESTKLLGSKLLSLAGGIDENTKGEIKSESQTTEYGETTNSDPYEYEGTVLYYTHTKRMKKSDESEGGSSEGGGVEYEYIETQKANSIVLEVQTGNESSKDKIKSISADVFIRVEIEQSDKPTVYKLYHTRLKFSKEKDLNESEFDKAKSAYAEGRKKLADLDEQYAQTRKEKEQSLVRELTEMKESYNETLAEIEKQKEEDIYNKKKDLKEEIESILSDYNSRIANEKDASKVVELRVDAENQAAEARKKYNEEKNQIESDAKKEAENADKDFYEQKNEYVDKGGDELEEIDNNHSTNKESLEKEIRPNLPNSSVRLELWSVDIADLMNQCYEKPVPVISEKTRSGSVRVSVKIEDITNFAMEVDWDYLTGYDFSEYYNIAKRHNELIKGKISDPELETEF